MGELAVLPQGVAARIGAKLRYDDETTCWLWTGAHNGHGYGRIYVEGKWKYPHRLTYQLAHGEIPLGLQLDHLCRNPACCNPSHLEPVTNRENTLRGKVSAMRDRTKPTHCKRGHAYAERGTIGSKGELVCRECTRLRRFNKMRAEGRPQRKPYPVKGSNNG